MPRIDPNQLLRCLSVLLSQNGGIKSKDEVARIVSLMTKFSKKLVSKCIYVLILKTTEADLLDMFMSAGGWDLTNNWLNDSIQIENWPLVLEIVELLLLCPVDLERLKGNNCPKAIKMLSKDVKAPEKVRLLASNVVEQWLAVVKSSCEATTSQSESPQGNHSEEEMEEDGDYGEEEKKIQAPYKIKIVEGKTVLAEIINDQVAGSTAISEDVEMKEIENEKTKNTSESKRVERKRADKRSPTDNEEKDKHDKKKMSSEKRLKLDLKAKMKEKERQWAKEKEKEREKEREKQHKERAKQEEKDKAVLSKLMTPTLTNVGKIPKKSKDDKKDKTDEKPKKSEPVKPPPQPKDPKKYNISVEIRKGEERPKTVKTFNSKFRSTGLEELPPPPKSVKKGDSKKSEDEKKPAKISKEEKKPKEEEKEKAEKTPPKPKVLQESDVFADALTAANPVRDVKKRKRRPSNSTSSETAKKETVSSPVQTKTEKPEEQKPVFKFYQDTLITSEDKVKEEPKEEFKAEKLDESVEEEAEADFPQFSKAEIEDEVAKAEEAIDEVLKREEKKNVEREKNRLPTGVLTYIKKTSAVKKGVTWKPEDQLESVRYFELDETERVNVTKAFSDMKQIERSNERLHLQRKTNDDVMEEKTVWRPLIPVDIVGEIVIPGKNSLEKEIQQARERTTLQAIYFDKSMIPDSPAEPDLEIHSTTEPTIIPLDDQTGNPDSVISYKNKPWPEPKGFEPGLKSNESPPQMAFQDPPMLQQPPPIIGNPQFGPGPGPFPNVPFIPGQGMMGQDWMVNGEPNMMNDNNMMMMGMNPGMPGMNPNMPAMNMPPNMMPPGMMGPPDMFQGPPDMMPQFFGPNPGMFGPRPGGPFPGNNGPPMQDNMRNPRPWFNKQNGGPPGSGGSWRHPNKNNMKGGNNWKTKGICNNFSRKGFCRIPNCQYKHIKPNKNR